MYCTVHIRVRVQKREKRRERSRLLINNSGAVPPDRSARASAYALHAPQPQPEPQSVQFPVLCAAIDVLFRYIYTVQHISVYYTVQVQCRVRDIIATVHNTCCACTCKWYEYVLHNLQLRTCTPKCAFIVQNTQV